MTTPQPTVAGAGEMCRLTVYGPASRIELAVPAYVPLADLLPTFLTHLGGDLATTGLAHGGWVLQRLGEPALDEDLGTAALGLYDGDSVHLRPRADQLPPVDFDDLVDGVATGIAGRADGWRPELTRRALLGLLGVLLAYGLALVPGTGSGTRAAVLAGGAALVLVLAAGAASRAVGDAAAARILAAGGIGYAALAGLTTPAGADPAPAGPHLLTAGGLVGAGVAAAVAGLLAYALTGTDGPLWTALGLAGGIAATSAALVPVAGVSAAGAAAVGLILALVAGVAVPMFAARVAGLRIASLPTSAAEFQTDIDPVPSREVLDRTAAADRYVGALYLGLGAATAGFLLVLAHAAGWAPPALAGAAAGLLLLHARELRTARQRLSALVPGLLGALAVVWSQATGPDRRLAAVLALAAAVAVVALLARTLPGARLLPHWGRVADIGHLAAAVALVPLALAVLDLFARARNHSG
jgi:type VII secretion integral membrane protein EccD